MFPLLAALGAVVGLVAYAVNKATAPAEKPRAERDRLEALKRKGTPQTGFLSLDEAEDGLVLARRFGDGKAALKFSAVIARLRPRRVKI